MVSLVLSQEANWPERKADHSSPYNAEVKKSGAILPFPHTTSWHTAEVIKHRDIFIFFRSTKDIAL
jgi:hypothetical protein